jgi:hypothetical protein
MGDSGGIIHSLLTVLIIGVCCLLIWWVGNWALGSFGAPPMFVTLWNGLFIFIALFVALNFLLGLLGHPLVAW